MEEALELSRQRNLLKRKTITGMETQKWSHLLQSMSRMTRFMVHLFADS